MAESFPAGEPIKDMKRFIEPHAYFPDGRKVLLAGDPSDSTLLGSVPYVPSLILYLRLLVTIQPGSHNSRRCRLRYWPQARKGKLALHPIYRVINRSGASIRISRRREFHTWELECLLMFKVMPHQLLHRPEIMKDLKANQITPDIVPLLRCGIVLEVPQHFI